MVEAIARIRFAWDQDFSRCRASAFDIEGRPLGDVTVELPAETRSRIQTVRGAGSQLRIEEVAERHLRAMLDLRY